jgi:hypothetical protein
LVLTVALLAGLVGAALLYGAHRPAALIVLGALGFFGGALKLFDSMIELKVSRSILWFRRSTCGSCWLTSASTAALAAYHAFQRAPWRGAGPESTGTSIASAAVLVQRAESVVSRPGSNRPLHLPLHLSHSTALPN